MDVVAAGLVNQIITLAVATAFGFVIAEVKQSFGVQKAIREGMKVILRMEIVDAYEKYVVAGAPLSIERKHEVDAAFKAYHDGLHANGTGEHMYNEFCKVPITVIGADSGDAK